MKSKLVLALPVYVLLACLASTAMAAITLNFDGLPPADEDAYESPPVPNGYGGLNWNNIHYLKLSGPIRTHSGYAIAMVSGDYLAFNSEAEDASVSGSPFTFNSAYLTGAWNDGLNVQIRGLLAGVELYNQTVVVDTTGPSFFTFDYVGIDTLTFSSFGGTPHPGLFGRGTHFAMDNFSFTPSVPEPASLSLFAIAAMMLRWARC